MNIGIVIAMDKEFQRVKALLSGAQDDVVYGRRFVSGTVGANRIELLQAGIGKVNAAIGAAELINAFAPDAVVSTGVAGGAARSLDVGEVVVSTATCYHDVYCGAEAEDCTIMGMPARFPSDRGLVEKLLGINCPVKITPGLIATGDWFVDTPAKMRDILSHHPDALAVDMESAAIAQACHLHDVPFVSFRIISDIPLKENNTQTYWNFWEQMADSSFQVTKALLNSL